jgi:hypothetical protein
VSFRFVSSRRRWQDLRRWTRSRSLAYGHCRNIVRLRRSEVWLSRNLPAMTNPSLAVTICSCRRMALRCTLSFSALVIASTELHPTQFEISMLKEPMNSRRLGNTSHTSHPNSDRQPRQIMRFICILRRDIMLPVRKSESPRPAAQHQSRIARSGFAMFVGPRPLKKLPSVRRRKRTRSDVLLVIGGSRW